MLSRAFAGLRITSGSLLSQPALRGMGAMVGAKGFATKAASASEPAPKRATKASKAAQAAAPVPPPKAAPAEKEKKRGPTPFNMYFKQKYFEFRRDYVPREGMNNKDAFGELSRQIAESWKNVSEAEKAKYADMSKAAKSSA